MLCKFRDSIDIIDYVTGIGNADRKYHYVPYIGRRHSVVYCASEILHLLYPWLYDREGILLTVYGNRSGRR